MKQFIVLFFFVKVVTFILVALSYSTFFVDAEFTNTELAAGVPMESGDPEVASIRIQHMALITVPGKVIIFEKSLQYY